MPNHVHLLGTLGRAESASALMKAVAQRYAQWANRRWSRTGPLWAGRFHSSVVEDECYALRCHRYVERNPVRAGLVTDPSGYPWSSFLANAMGTPSRFLTTHEVVRGLGLDEASRRAAYRELFVGGEGEEELAAIREAIQGCKPLGTAAFRRRHRNKRGLTP